MGVHAVQNHPDAPAVSLTAQLSKILLGAQHRVRRFVVAGVVAVAGEALGNGIQIDETHPKARDIVHFFGDSPEIAAEKVVIQHLSVFCWLPLHVLVPAFVDSIGG